MISYIMVAWEEKCHNLKYSPLNLLVLSFYHWTQHHMGWKIPLLSWSQLSLPMVCPLLGDEGRQEESLVAVWAQFSSSRNTDTLSKRLKHRKGQLLWAAVKAACVTPSPEHHHSAGPWTATVGKGNLCSTVTGRVVTELLHRSDWKCAVLNSQGWSRGRVVK